MINDYDKLIVNNCNIKIMDKYNTAIINKFNI